MSEKRFLRISKDHQPLEGVDDFGKEASGAGCYIYKEGKYIYTQPFLFAQSEWDHGVLRLYIALVHVDITEKNIYPNIRWGRALSDTYIYKFKDPKTLWDFLRNNEFQEVSSQPEVFEIIKKMEKKELKKLIKHKI